MAVEVDQIVAQGVIGSSLSDDDRSSADVWVLGSKYTANTDDDQLRARVQQLPWFTYRRGFPKIGDTSIMSDLGWGCMLRCGQMILCETLLKSENAQGARAKTARWEAIAKFADDPSSPYSIQNVAIRGKMMDKEIGDWFGPNCMAQVLRSLSNDNDEQAVCIHVAMDGYVCCEEVLSRQDDEWKPMLLLVPLRLGLQDISEKYFDSLKDFFRNPLGVGAIGGRPNSAYYFVGYRENDLVYLDPHHVQPSVGVFDKQTPIGSYSCRTLDAISMSSVDPSMSLGFFCRSKEDFLRLMDTYKNKAPEDSCLFTVVEKDFTAGIANIDFDMDDEDEDEPVEDSGFELI